MEHQAVPRAAGIPDARALRLALYLGRGGLRRELESPGGDQVRDPLLHRLGYPGALPQDHREERLPGAALGAVHNAERQLYSSYDITEMGSVAAWYVRVLLLLYVE